MGATASPLRGAVAWKNGPVALADLKGKVVVLEFFATWCGPCVRGVPALVDLHDKYEGDVVIIGIAVEDAAFAEVRKAAWGGRDFPFPVMLAADAETEFAPAVAQKACGVVCADSGVTSFPTTRVIDKKGRLVGRFETDPQAIIFDGKKTERLGRAGVVKAAVIDKYLGE